MAIVRIDPNNPDPDVLDRAADILRGGGLVAFPTETVYGLGANALDASAVRRIFAAKGRPSFNPLIAHVPDAGAARRWTTSWPEAAQRLADTFWPGPLTIVLPKDPAIPDVVTAGLPTVALRVPAHPVALALVRAAGIPLAAPSANPFTGVSPTTAEHVARGLGDRVDLILDAGPTDVGIESAVVDLSGDQPTLLRPGILPVERIRSVIGEILLPTPPADAASPRLSPGMLERHYAPRAELRLFDPADRSRTIETFRRDHERGLTIGALLLTAIDAPIDYPLYMSADPAAYARELYAALHSLDERGCDIIMVERVPEDKRREGIADRLRRAATR